MKSLSFRDRTDSPGPKKLLALDGGGIRALITIEVLAEIERILRERFNDERLLLADYFDYVAGTSSGAMLAAAISWGMTVADLRTFFLRNSHAMFDKASLLERLRYKYRQEKLAGLVRKELGADTTLGSDRLKTLLMVVLRNATTDSPWPLSNNPRAKFNDPTLQDCNLNIPLWQILRACTAAPLFFPPEVIAMGSRKFVFLDGAVTTYNNPAFLLFLMATVEPYRLCWEANEEKMLLVSVGTGIAPQANADLKPSQMNVLYNAGSIPSALMYAAKVQQDVLCRIFGQCRSGDLIDSEVGDMCKIKGPLDSKLFSYVRYNVELSPGGLGALGLGAIDPRKVMAMDSTAAVGDLQRIGTALGAARVSSEHFAGFL
ncbi:MAG: patatin-like phospholipase family protein [Candidatus Eremiobacteraeota bacterium]|nr:patatin-like phospholipase family protein [Candidatus Eremiobacteraeota bacterium]